jgi:hypothetical protein
MALCVVSETTLYKRQCVILVMNPLWRCVLLYTACSREVCTFVQSIFSRGMHSYAWRLWETMGGSSIGEHCVTGSAEGAHHVSRLVRGAHHG